MYLNVYILHTKDVSPRDAPRVSTDFRYSSLSRDTMRNSSLKFRKEYGTNMSTKNCPYVIHEHVSSHTVLVTSIHVQCNQILFHCNLQTLSFRWGKCSLSAHEHKSKKTMKFLLIVNLMIRTYLWCIRVSWRSYFDCTVDILREITT